MSKSNKYALAGAERKAQITEAGAKLAAKFGAVNVTRRMVAAAAKVSEALVSAHMGATEEAQKAYRRALKKLDLAEPDKATIEAKGAELRRHKPRDARDTRKRSDKEKAAIKRKAPAKKAAVKKAPVKAKKSPSSASATAGVRKASSAETKPVKSPGVPAKPKEQKPVTTPGKAQPSPAAARKSAARKPMAPPPAAPSLPLPGGLPLPE